MPITYDWPEAFNYSKMNNCGVERASGDYVLFLNDDVEVIDGDWLESMLELAQRPEVGVVGARLLYPDGSVQHDGIVVGPEDSPGHIDFDGYFSLDHCIRNQAAVTGACMLLRKETFQELGGFDEKLAVIFNDVDLCLRARSQGYRVLMTPYASLYHHEKATRKRLHPPEEEQLFRDRWSHLLNGHDPYFSDHLYWWPASIAVDRELRAIKR